MEVLPEMGFLDNTIESQKSQGYESMLCELSVRV